VQKLMHQSLERQRLSPVLRKIPRMQDLEFSLHVIGIEVVGAERIWMIVRLRPLHGYLPRLKSKDGLPPLALLAKLL